MGWFHFKGKDSRDFGILISAAPEKVRAERRVEQVTIPGRSGELTMDEGTYAPYVLSVECSTRGSENLDEILAWLDGAGELILCTEPDKVFRASIYNKISVSDMIYLYNSFLLQFRVQPFKYSVNAAGDALELTAPTTIRNSGTVYSEPLITVYGSGDITLAGEHHDRQRNDGGIQGQRQPKRQIRRCGVPQIRGRAERNPLDGECQQNKNTAPLEMAVVVEK